MKDFEDELSPPEREAFASLPKEQTPPAFLEQRVVNALKESGLIQASIGGTRRSVLRLAYGVAAAVALLAVGIGLGVWWQSAPASPERSEFILVLRTPLQDAINEPPVESQRVKEYGSWAKQISKDGLLVSGEKLSDEARFLKVNNGQPSVSSNQPATDSTVIGGYFLIKAQSYEQAITIAQGCPHLKYGGTIEIRQLEH